MTTNIELTMASYPPALPVLKHIIDLFEQARRSSVQLTIIDWSTIWRELVNIGIYKRGADVSEVGTTWISSLISMNTLRAFTRGEIAQIGGERVFLPTSWQTTSMVGDARVLAIPFVSDVRMIYYWRDMLEKASVDEATAFSSFDGMEDAFNRLKEVVPTPWAISTDASTHDTLYMASTWVWAAGGDFVSGDNRKIRITEPVVRQALKTFFGLHRFMPRDGQPVNRDKVLELFSQRQVAAMMGAPWFLMNLRAQAQLADLLPQLGIALPPGPPFVGGMNLVVWQHTRYEQECIELIRHLVTPKAQVELCRLIGLMPARIEALADPFYADDPLYKILADALHKGRVFTGFPLLGMVEDRLSANFAQIWLDLFNRPDDSLDMILLRHLDVLAKRLDITLGG